MEWAIGPQGRNLKFSIRRHATSEKIIDKALKSQPIRELVGEVFAWINIAFPQNMFQDLPLKIVTFRPAKSAAQ